MQKVNIRDVPEEYDESPKGKFASYSQGVSLALGREAASFDLRTRHPFDVELSRVPPGKAHCPYHSHSAQWEFYLVASGEGTIRDETGKTRVGPGDAFLFPPGQAHQILNEGTADFVYYCVADNPIGESCHYPDSGKWIVRSPERRLIRSEPLDYFDGEE